MPRPSLKSIYLQNLKSDAFYADEVINIYLLRPLAAVVVWLVYPTKITPNQVTLFAILLGCIGAGVYLYGTPLAVAAAGTLVVLKDIFDDADGQLARARGQYSRRGRFLDSIGDFAVDVVVFSAITAVVYRHNPFFLTILLGCGSLAGITLRVSYHVYYQVSFLHGQNRYHLNRIVESVTQEDLRGDRVALRLQQVFNVIYTWQDRLVAKVDRWCMRENFDDLHLSIWYADRFGLRLSGLLGFGTELFILGICSWLNQLYLYLWINLVFMNGLLLTSIFYRRCILSANIPRKT